MVEQDQENLKNSEDPPLDFGDYLPESDEFSLSFVDSFLHYDDWIEEQEGPRSDFGQPMADSGVEVVDKNLETGNDSGFGLVEDEVGEKSKSLEVRVSQCETGDEPKKEVGDLGSLIEKEMGKVSIGCFKCDIKKDKVVGVVGDCVESNGVLGVEGNEIEDGEKLLPMVKVEDLKSDDNIVSDEQGESDGDSESKSLSSASSSSSSSSSSSDDDDDEEEDDDEVRVKKELEEREEEGDMEEGEIRDSVEEDMAASSDDEDYVGGGGVAARPIRSKNEVQDLPSVPPVNVTMQPHHQPLPVGVILSMIGAQVIVEGVEHNPLSEGSIIWITESRSPLGIVDEIFGPVKNPYYIVRYNSESEVPSGIHLGSPISFVPEFVDYILNNKDLYQKGYDASGENDEELSDEVEFSDDEKEAEYKRIQKMTKRGTNDQEHRNIRNDKKNVKNRKHNDHQPSPTSQASQGTGQQQLSHANSPRPQRPVQGYPGGPCSTPSFQQMPQAANFPAASSGVWTDGNNYHQPSPTSQASRGTGQQPFSHANSPRPQGPVQGYPGGPGSTPFQQMPQAANFPAASSGVWTNGVPSVQQQSMSMGFPSGFPANMAWMQQNYTPQNFQMPLPSGAPFHQQFNAGQVVPPNLVLQGQPNLFAGPALSPWSVPSMGQQGFNQQQLPTAFPGLVAPLSVNNQPQFPTGSQGQVAPSSMNNQPQFLTGFQGQVPPQSVNNQPQFPMCFQGQVAPSSMNNQPQFLTGFQGQVALSSMNNQPQFLPGFQGQVAPSSMNSQPQFLTGFQGQVAPQSMNVLQQGVGPNGALVENSSGMRPPVTPANSATSQNSSQGGNSNRGGRQPFRRGGGGRGRFGGRRGGRQPRGRS